MAKVYGLSDDDVKVLKLMADDYRNRRGNTTYPIHQQDYTQSPDVYIALTQQVGTSLPYPSIPAITRLTGTGTEDYAEPGDMPGSAVCNIYQLVGGVLVQVSSLLNKTVYNFSEQPIPGEWMMVMRDKFGTWWAMPNLPTVYVGIAQQHIGTGGSGLVERLSATLGFTGVQDIVVSNLGAVHVGNYVIYARSSEGFVALNTSCPVGTGS